MVCKIASKIAKHNIDEVLELIALAILDIKARRFARTYKLAQKKIKYGILFV